MTAMQHNALSGEWLTQIGVTMWAPRTAFLGAQSAQATHNSEVSKQVEVEKSWWLIGPGLADIWQNDTHQAWLLWRAMAEFHFEGLDAVHFFDTQTMQDESQVELAVEKIIESGIVWVFSMDEQHPLHHQLAEGLPLVVLPHFETLIAQPILKRDAYLRLLEPTDFLSYADDAF